MGLACYHQHHRHGHLKITSGQRPVERLREQIFQEATSASDEPNSTQINNEKLSPMASEECTTSLLTQHKIVHMTTRELDYNATTNIMTRFK